MSKLAHSDQATMDAIDRRRMDEAGITRLDLAWEQINALGGRADQNNSYDQGAVDAINKALAVIEALGGKDPLQRRAEAAHSVATD